MIKTKMNGTTAHVTRTLKLPKTGGLNAQTLTRVYKIETGLSSKDAKTDVGKAMLKNLPGVLDNTMNAVRKAYDDKTIKIWTDAGAALLKPGCTEKDAAKIAETAEKNIAANWNAYSKKIEGDIKANLESLRQSEEKKAGDKIAQMKVKISSDSLTPDRINLLSFVLQALTFAGKGPVGWITESLKMFGKTLKAINSATNIMEKRSTEVQANLNQISDGLDAAATALEGTKTYLERIKVAQSVYSAQVIEARSQLDKMTSELEKLEKRAASEKAVREGEVLKELRSNTQLKFFELNALEKTVEAQSDLQKVMQKAMQGVSEAQSKVVARRKGWNATNAETKKASKNMDTYIGTVARVLKSVG